MTKTLAKRLATVLVLVCLFSSIYYLDRYRGGNIEKPFACILTNSKLENAFDSVIIFGTSRSLTAFDTHYINTILKHEDGLEQDSVARFAIHRKDLISSYFLLENRIKYGRAPKLVVLELMLETRNSDPNTRKNRGRIKNLLDYKQQNTYLQKFKGSSKKGTDRWEFLQAHIDRTTALLYGAIKNPGVKFWDPKSCSKPSDWIYRKWVSGEHSAKGNSVEEIERSRSELESGYNEALSEMQKADSKWSRDMRRYLANKNKRKPPSSESPVYNIDRPNSKKAIRNLRANVRLAEKNGAKVIIVPMVEYYQTLDQKELEMIQDLFPKATIYDIFSEARPTVNAHMTDLHHISKKGSMLMSALLSQQIVRELKND